MRTTLFAISLIMLLTASSVYAEKHLKALHGLDAVSYSAGFGMVDSFNKLDLSLDRETVMRGINDARRSIRPLIPKGKMRLILHDPKKYLTEDQEKPHPDKESKALYGLSAVSYAAGFRMGDTFKKQRVTLVPAMVTRGLVDAQDSGQPLIPPAEMRVILRDPKKYLIENSDQRADHVKMSSQSFLEENAGKEGVVTLPSGLQYKVLASGKGKSPGMDDQVTVNYVGTRIDGTEFDSSAKNGKPATFPLKGLIEGWSEALQLMHEGDTWQLFVPANLAYGNRGPLANQALIFEIELLKVSAP